MSLPVPKPGLVIVVGVVVPAAKSFDVKGDKRIKRDANSASEDRDWFSRSPRTAVLWYAGDQR